MKSLKIFFMYEQQNNILPQSKLQVILKNILAKLASYHVSKQ